MHHILGNRNTARIGLAAGGSPPSGYTLVYDAFTAGNNAQAFGDTTNTYYLGEANYNDSVARAIGKISVRLTKSVGSITGKTYTVRIWSMTGNALNTVLASTTGVTGSDAWSNTAVDFTFASPYTISTGTNYSVTVDAGGTDALNYASAFFNNTGASAPWPCDYGIWTDAKANLALFSGYYAEMKLYTSP